MKYTDKNYFIDKKEVEKLELMIKRMKRGDDNVVIIDGDEGQGKSNKAAQYCYYISYRTGRNYTVKENIFFDLDELVKFASSTKEKIIHWDEGALGGLTLQWWKKNQQKFIQLLMVARKKKHFMVICIPKFYKLNEYVIVDRSIALVHVYSRQNLYKGRFFYYTKAKKEALVEDWRRRHTRAYRKHVSLWGTFPEAMKHIFNKEELKEYEDKKDEAILSISKDDNIRDKNLDELRKLKFAYARLPEVTVKKKAENLKVNVRTIARFKEIEHKYPDIVAPLLT